MQLAITLIMLGVLMGMPTAMYSFSRPRRAGEPLGPVRTVLLSLSFTGFLFVVVGASIFVSSG